MYRKIEDMMWPAPCEYMRGLEDKVRYRCETPLSVRERMLVASIIEAYQQLISDPKKKRDMIVSELRKEPNIRLSKKLKKVTYKCGCTAAGDNIAPFCSLCGDGILEEEDI